jgi:hypothetical protein
MISDRTATIIIVMVAVVWTVAMIADMMPDTLLEYEMPSEAHYIFAGIVGGAFGVKHRSLGARIDRGGDHRA